MACLSSYDELFGDSIIDADHTLPATAWRRTEEAELELTQVHRDGSPGMQDTGVRWGVE